MHKYEEITDSNRVRDPQQDGSDLSFTPLEHNWDCVPEALLVEDMEGHSLTFAPDEVKEYPQNPSQRREELAFRVIEHDAQTMPTAIEVTDPQGRGCRYVPISVDGRPVKSHYFTVGEDTR
jgi:hypothetical protein